MIRKSEKTHSEAIGSIPFVAGLLYGPMCMSVARFYTPDDHVKPTSLSNCLTVSIWHNAQVTFPIHTDNYDKLICAQASDQLILSCLQEVNLETIKKYLEF